MGLVGAMNPLKKKIHGAFTKGVVAQLTSNVEIIKSRIFVNNKYANIKFNLRNNNNNNNNSIIHIKGFLNYKNYYLKFQNQHN